MLAEPQLPVAATPLELDRLPMMTGWPATLLGLRARETKRRNRQEVLREYDTEKWGTALAALRAHDGVPTQNDILRAAGADISTTVAFSHAGRLYSDTYGPVLQAYLNWIVESVRPFRPEVLVELGSGLGDKLLWLQRDLGVPSVLGGEFTPAGVAAGQLLAERNGQQAKFYPYDFTDPATIAFVPEGAVVYTSHAIEQIPLLSASFIDALAARKPRVVLHFEPCYEGCSDDSLIALMTRRYAQVNDYNRNLKGLLEALTNKGLIELMDVRPNVYGINPLNPTTLYVWRPRS